MKQSMLVLLMAVLFDPLLAHAVKPRSPLQVNISPVQTGLSSTDIKPANIKPGDVVKLKIAGKTFADADELNIKVELYGGVELVSGDTSWSGPANKGEDKTLLITVRTPIRGNGGVRARISMSPSSGATFTAEAEYHLGQKMEKKPDPVPVIKKDNKGREIREYRVN